MNVIAGATQILFKSEQHIDTHPLVLLQHIVEHIVGSIEKEHGTQREYSYKIICTHARAHSLEYQEAHGEGRKSHLQPHYVARNNEL